MTYIYSCI